MRHKHLQLSIRSKGIKWREAIPHNNTITTSVLPKTDQRANMKAESTLTFRDKFPYTHASSALLHTKNPIETLHLIFVPTKNLQMFSLIRTCPESGYNSLA